MGALAAAAMLVMPTTALAGPSDLLPDLRMARPNEWHLTVENTSQGSRRLLRFSARIINVGDGPIIVRGRRSCATSACPHMTLEQRIKRTNGKARTVASEGVGKYSGDGHDHWHVMRFERYMMIPLDLPPETVLESTRGAKIGFCFLDTNPWDRSLPGAPQYPVFPESGCGRYSSTRIRMGISVGWADRYYYSLPRQYFDTTGLPDGRYLICNTADASSHWLEKNEDNNDSWAIVRLSSGPNRVTVVDPGRRTSCESQLPPPPPETETWDLDFAESEPVFMSAEVRASCLIEDRRRASVASVGS
jgi:hypothetical protein